MNPVNKKKISLGLLVLVVALVLGYVVSSKILQKEEPVPVVVENTNTNTNQPEPATPVVTEPNLQDKEIKVNWSNPTPVPSPDIFTKDTSQFFGEQVDLKTTAKVFKVGTVSAGEYAGGSVLLGSVQADGPGTYVFSLINSSGRNILVYKNSQISEDFLDKNKVTIDKSAIFKDLIYPDKITYGGDTLFIGGPSYFSNSTDVFFSTYYKPQDIKVAFVDPKMGNVYTDIAPKYGGIREDGSTETTRNGFYVKAPDGTLRIYALLPYFLQNGTTIPIIKWNDGTNNATDYTYTDFGGCGSTNFASIVPSLTMNDLVVVGTAGDSTRKENIYELKNPNHSLLLEQYRIYYPQDGEQKMPYDQFVKSHPLFFWKDSFGRIIKFTNTHFMSGAECGKPVIYLYPEQTTKVSVKLDPKGGFTKSEPAYENGWNVVATPQGKLTEIKSGKSFPYLFWEGRGGLYETPKKGFVVKNADVHIFLNEKLSKLGLNEKEKADFIEFWEPRIKGSPYYFVTFMGNQTMNEIAPLSITPKPDTVIRVLMDFLPLEKSIPVEEFNIRTPERKGFTVVEWGGVLR